jgi:hypothetical protein
MTVGLALALGLMLTELVLAQRAQPSLLISSEISPPPLTELPISLPTYARVITGGVPVYQHPSHATTSVDPIRVLDTGYVWVTVANPQPVQHGDDQWYMINPDEYVQSGYLELYQPSTFRGIARPGPGTFAWMIFDAWTAPAAGEAPGDGSVLLKRYSRVPISEEMLVGDRVWYRVGQGQWIEQGMVGIVRPKPRPEGIPPDDKWIEVDLYEQTLAAYEGDEIIYATLISSGLPWWQTEQGLFKIWIKVRQAKMSGREGYPDYYFLEDVPWTMYFNRNFALHGAYWHDRFGIKHSHGCVNLPLADAKWLFEWAGPVDQTGWTLATEENVGTWVWVHE